MNTEVGKESPGAAGPPLDLGIPRLGWQGIYITNGGYDQARGYTAVADGTADAVAFGTLFLANSDLVTRFRLDTPAQRARSRHILWWRQTTLYRLPSAGRRMRPGFSKADNTDAGKHAHLTVIAALLSMVGPFTIGTGVIGGMLAATIFAIFLVPAFFAVVWFPGHGRHGLEEAPHG